MSDIVETRVVEGDVSVGRNVSVGGKVNVQGSMTVGHNLEVKGWIRAANTPRSNLGIFGSLAELEAAYSSITEIKAEEGYYAGVLFDDGGQEKVRVYRFHNGAWTQTNIEMDIELDFMEYVNQAETAASAASGYAADANTAKGEALSAKNAAEGHAAWAQRYKGAANDYSNEALSAKNAALEAKGNAESYASAARTAMEEAQAVLSTIAVGDAVIASYNAPEDNEYNICDIDNFRLAVVNGKVYSDPRAVPLTAGTNAVAIFFTNPAVIPSGAFDKVSILKGIHIPSYVRLIDNNAFHQTSLTMVECESMTPPQGQGISDIACTVYVHTLALTLYQHSSEWSNKTLAAIPYNNI